MQNHTSSNGGYLASIASLRFFAALAVVILHLQHFLPFDVTRNLGTAVSFFFVLSGFILTIAYGQQFSIKQFYLNRVARLWPTHLFCFLLVVFLIRPVPLTTDVWQSVAFVNLALLQSWFPVVGVPFSFNAPSWSISTELAFYALFPFLVRTRYLGRITLVTVLLTLATLIGMEGFARPDEPELFHFWPEHFMLIFPLMRIGEFITGMYAAKLFLNMQAPKRYATGYEILALFGMLAFWLSTGSLNGVMADAGLVMLGEWYKRCGAMVFFAITIAVFAWQKGAISTCLSHPVLVKLGEISFCTYMLHQIVIRYWKTLGFDVAWYIHAGAILAITYAGSWLLHTYWEKPAKQIILNGMPKIKQLAPALKRVRIR